MTKKVSLVLIFSIIGVIISLVLMFGGTLTIDILKLNAPRMTCMFSIIIGVMLGITSVAGIIYHCCNEYWRNR